MIEVFARCTTCGLNGIKVRQIKRWAKDNDIPIAVHTSGTLKTTAANDVHMMYLKQSGLPENLRIGIVVEDGKKVTRLSEWSL